MRLFTVLLFSGLMLFLLSSCVSQAVTVANTPTIVSSSVVPTLPATVSVSPEEQSAAAFCDFLYQRKGENLIANYYTDVPIVDSITALYSITKEQITTSPGSRVYLWYSHDLYFGSTENWVRLHGSNDIEVSTVSNNSNPPRFALIDILKCVGVPTHYSFWEFSGDFGPALDGKSAKVFALFYTDADLIVQLLVPHDINPFTEQTDYALFSADKYSPGRMTDILDELDFNNWSSRHEWPSDFSVPDN